MHTNLFAYGSLMIPDIFSRVTQEVRPAVAATLHGWKRCQVADQPYPAIVRAPEVSVTGVLWMGLSELERPRRGLTRKDAHQSTALARAWHERATTLVFTSGKTTD